MRWQSSLPLFDPTDLGAARLALAQIASSLSIYHEEGVAHLPASRWDSDFGDELGKAKQRLRELPDVAPSPAPPGFVRDALDRRYEEAIQAAVESRARSEKEGAPALPLERAVAKVLGMVCRIAGDAALADSLER